MATMRWSPNWKDASRFSIETTCRLLFSATTRKRLNGPTIKCSLRDVAPGLFSAAHGCYIDQQGQYLCFRLESNRARDQAREDKSVMYRSSENASGLQGLGCVEMQEEGSVLWEPSRVSYKMDRQRHSGPTGRANFACDGWNVDM